MGLYLFDTHVHTSETSDCANITGAEIARLYQKNNYSGIVITDHFHAPFFDSLADISWRDKITKFLAGYHAALCEGKKIGLDVLLGMEIRFTEGPNDYLVFGFDKAFLLENPDLYKVGLRRFRQMIEGKNMRIYQAHPFRKSMVRVSPTLLDGVEVYNGNPRHNSYNHRAREYAEQNALGMISGSDAHSASDASTSGITLTKPIKTNEELIHVLDYGSDYTLMPSDS